MAEDTDFVALYDELGVGAACAIEQFKQAYRRRVGQLHPDAVGHAGGTDRLQVLNRQYEAAMQFYREHGRLPGAPFAYPPRPAPPQRHAPAAGHEEMEHAGEEPAGSGGKLRFILLAATGLSILVWATLSYERREASAAREPAAAADHAVPQTEVSGPIQFGMDEQEVKQVLGEPLDVHGTRWEYGPSWVEFHCGKLDGWYSSPLRPLRVSSSAEHAREIWAARPDGNRRCGE